MKYFAYGANMFTPYLRQPHRAPNAAPLGSGVLAGHEVRFHKRSLDGSGKCTIIPCVKRQAFGVVFEINPDEKPCLDKAEGLGYGYSEESLVVSHGGGTLRVFTYVADPGYIDPRLAPYGWYRDMVVAGAREHHLPEQYTQHLHATNATEDPDHTRDACNRRILSCRAGVA